MHAIEHLQEYVWKKSECYGGFSPDGDYVVMSRNRDSQLLTRVNWDVACESLKAQPYDGGAKHFFRRPTVYHWRAGHWAVGWIEYLCVRADAADDVKTEASEIVCSLADYSILDEDRYCAAKWDAVCEYWEQCSVGERVDYLRDSGISIFAARRDTLPEDPNGYLFEALSHGL